LLGGQEAEWVSGPALVKASALESALVLVLDSELALRE
jgi:hypothetical protein